MILLPNVFKFLVLDIRIDRSIRMTATTKYPLNSRSCWRRHTSVFLCCLITSNLAGIYTQSALKIEKNFKRIWKIIHRYWKKEVKKICEKRHTKKDEKGTPTMWPPWLEQQWWWCVMLTFAWPDPLAFAFNVTWWWFPGDFDLDLDLLVGEADGEMDRDLWEWCKSGLDFEPPEEW